jgi:ubiquinone/menaquinone biosynthesis C-methylase UbiE
MTSQPIEQLRRANYEIAEAIAPGWERRRAFLEEVTTPVRSWILQELAPRPGQTLLELAAGAGDTGFAAAAIVGGSGRLISTDFSPAMVEVARRRGVELGVDNVEYGVVDAERIELDADSVDAVVCRYGYMLMADPAAALAERRRVLRPGGRLALAVWGAPDRNPFFAIIAMTLVRNGHMPPPQPEAPGIFSMASEESTRTLLEGAGFGRIRIEEVPLRFAFGDIDEYVGVVTDTAGPIAIVLRRLTEDERAGLVAQVEAALVPFAAEAGYELPGVALCAVAD